MAKRIITLTEAEINRVISESVKRILSEHVSGLDPRTIASYAQKRREQADAESMSRREKLDAGDPTWNQHDPNPYRRKAEDARNTAIDTFNAQYGDDDFKMGTSGFGSYNISVKDPSSGNKETYLSHKGRLKSGNIPTPNRGYKVAQEMSNPNPEQHYTKSGGWD